ncbi:MAG: peptidylprolyl isomerase [Planctomyces sp.]|nr:peptidylprolyl isomerase [Planctomyces sp.]MBA4038941.1 peptidylprolyl isomerase [Planctomyces sp.]MBA4119129.1 peptidylprolyl isomerase [Isosphaera sp.]
MTRTAWTRSLLAITLPATLALAAASAPAVPPEPAAAQAPAQDQKETYVYVKLATSLGEIVLELNQTKAPISVENFLAYVDAGHYNGLIFHRVIPNFMVQGGGFTPDLNQKPTNAPIKNEWRNGLKNAKYTVAMARTNVADSATSQFFINVANNTFLDEPRDGAAYAVFGKVIQGTEIVDTIVTQQTKTVGPHQNVPATPITITTATRLSADEIKDKTKG